MARHRATAAHPRQGWRHALRRLAFVTDSGSAGDRPPEPGEALGQAPAPLSPEAVHTAPETPNRVTLHYPDGEQLDADCRYDGPSIDPTRHRWVAVVPDTARLVNGMLVRVDHDCVLAVAVRNHRTA